MVGRGWFILLGVVCVVFAMTVAVPIDHGGGHGNDAAAIAILRNLSSAQAAFQRYVAADRDGDGRGEFGGFRELSGAVKLSGEERAFDPPLLSGAFRRPLADGRVSRSGYFFRIYLATNTGTGFSPDDVRAGGRALTPGEDHWCCYAWPVIHGESGERTYFVNQSGDILATDDPVYDGDRGPRPGAAFREFGLDRIVGRTAAGTTGQDGSAWRRVN
jgi:hypothetical protein